MDELEIERRAYFVERLRDARGKIDAAMKEADKRSAHGGAKHFMEHQRRFLSGRDISVYADEMRKADPWKLGPDDAEREVISFLLQFTEFDSWFSDEGKRPWFEGREKAKQFLLKEYDQNPNSIRLRKLHESGHLNSEPFPPEALKNLPPATDIIDQIIARMNTPEVEAYLNTPEVKARVAKLQGRIDQRDRQKGGG